MESGQIGRYELYAPLGRGGMGTVYKARDPFMDRWVAIKTLTVKDAEQRARFQQEVRAAGGLNHPHITTIYDVGEIDDLAYIVMELVEGTTLAERLSSTMAWSEAATLLMPVCQALAYAHQKGVVHRDVKPANILISSDGQVKLTDFGVARLEAALRRITKPGSTIGTPLYTAPEQIRNEETDGRADIFSVGIILYELVTGRHPFVARELSLIQVINLMAQPEPADLTRLKEAAPPAFATLVGLALSKDPAARFADAEALAAALAACLEQPDVSPPPPDLPKPEPANRSMRPVLDLVASNLSLSPAEETLLRQAFAGYDRLFIEREFSSGYSGARVLLVTPVRSEGRRLAQLVLKLDTPPAIEHEWKAYQSYVRETLPPVTARIHEEPHYSPDKQLALLQYSFAGGLGNMPPESLRSYYTKQPDGELLADLLDKKLFDAFGSKWWLQRRTADLIIRREYDRLLPVHLQVEYREAAEGTETARSLVAGETSVHTYRQLEAGQLVQIQGFTAAEIEAERDNITVTLQARSPSGSRTNPVRIRVTGLKPGQLKQAPGQKVPALSGIVIAARHDLLCERARPALPNQDFDQKQITIGQQLYPNPIYDYEALLDQHIATMSSIIHGDLNLENILVTPGSGLAWLIDFADTREGHSLYDFIRLETQVITKLLPATRAKPETVVQLMQALHRSEPTLPRHLPAELGKPFAVLTAIRRMVRVCLYNRDSWDEYYLGLVITLLGALKFKELEPPARALALAAAAAVRGLISLPALQVTPPPISPAAAPAQRSRLTPVRLAAGGIVLAALAGLWFLLPGFLVPPPMPTPQTATTVPVVAVTAALPATSTEPPTATPTPSPPPSSSPLPSSTASSSGFGLAVEPLDIHSGPDLDYPPLGSVPEGNRLQIIGRSADDEWWQIIHATGPGGYGWVQAEFVKTREPLTPPVATAAPPPTFTPAPTSSPVPTACPTPAFFPDLAVDYPTLGCPTGRWRSDFTLQQFERGWMIWRKMPEPAQIFILYEDGNWRQEKDPEGPALPSCTEGQETDGLGPIFSFGVIWCDDEIDRLGLPLTGETASEDSPIEQFEHGLAFELDQLGQIILQEEDWLQVSTTLEPQSPAPTNLPQSFASQADFLDQWQAFANEGTVTVAEGALSLSTGASQTFPYVRTRQNPFPTGGDFSLVIEFQYSQVGEFGAGIVLGAETPENNLPVQAEANPDVELLKVWQDNSYYEALIVGNHDTVITSLESPDTDRHKIQVDYRNGVVQIYLDNRLVAEEFSLHSRPSTLWLGNPYRTAENGEWSALKIFSVSVKSLDTPPAESRASTASSGVSFENFDSYTAASLRQSYALNTAWDNNALTIDVTKQADVVDRGQALALAYKINAAHPDNYVGVERNLSQLQDWSTIEAIRFWVHNDGVLREFTFQWGEASQRGGEVWKTSLTLEPDETGFVKIPLTEAKFHLADWSPVANQKMEPGQVGYYGFFIAQAQPGEGTVYLDSLSLLPAIDAPRIIEPAAIPQPQPPPCSIQPAPEFQPVWELHGDSLGCAEDSAYTLGFLVAETFEGGHLFWREDTDEVYLIHDRQKNGSQLLEGDWSKPPWKWDGVAACQTEQTPPPGLLRPERGFGWLWCTHLGGPDGRLGWALTKEEGFQNLGRVQQFENGLAFRANEPKLYALLADGRFLAHTPEISSPAPQPASPEFSDTGFRPAAVFEAAWAALDQGEGPLGYPLGAAIIDRNYARQPFEKGFMFWWDSPQDPKPVWVIHIPDPLANQGDTWQRYDDLWRAGQPEFPPACPQAGPPLGPRNGFGLTWCNEAGVKDLIGLPRDLEFGSGNVFAKGAVQFFQGGVMLENPVDSQIWVLSDNDGWYRFGY